jgi:sugar phosphate isomerase/epimerase
MISINGTDQPLVLANSTSLRTATFAERVRVAAAAGFDGIGIDLATYRRAIAEVGGVREVAALLRAHALRAHELESVLGYAVSGVVAEMPLRGGRTYTTPAEVEQLCELAALLGGAHIVAVGALHTGIVEDDAAARFAALCDVVAPHGLGVALEIHPRSNVPDLALALRVIRAANRPNGGLNLDAWHHIRGGNDGSRLRELRSTDVVVLQVSDGPTTSPEDYVYEMLHCRQVPGEGSFDLRGFIGSVLAAGCSVPVSVEVISDQLLELPALEAAETLARATRAVVNDARLELIRQSIETSR